MLVTKDKSVSLLWELTPFLSKFFKKLSIVLTTNVGRLVTWLQTKTWPMSFLRPQQQSQKSLRKLTRPRFLRVSKVALFQWYGHPRVLGSPIPKTLVMWASPSCTTLAIWVRVRVRVTEDIHITRVLRMGMLKTRGYPYHCGSAITSSELPAVPFQMISECTLAFGNLCLCCSSLASL